MAKIQRRRVRPDADKIPLAHQHNPMLEEQKKWIGKTILVMREEDLQPYMCQYAQVDKGGLQIGLWYEEELLPASGYANEEVIE